MDIPSFLLVSPAQLELYGAVALGRFCSASREARAASQPSWNTNVVVEGGISKFLKMLLMFKQITQND